MPLFSIPRSCIESSPSGMGLISPVDSMSWRTATMPTSWSRAQKVPPSAAPADTHTRRKSLQELAIRRRCSKAWAKCLHEGSVPSNGIRLNLVGKIASVFDVDNAITRLGLSGTVANAARHP